MLANSTDSDRTLHSDLGLHCLPVSQKWGAMHIRVKGEGSRTTRIGLVNRGKIKVNEQKHHSTFLCMEHFYFQDRRLFFCVDPLLLCYRVLNMGRVALF